MKRDCPECLTNPRPGQRMCSRCHAEYMREYRKKHRVDKPPRERTPGTSYDALSDEQRKRANARSYAKVYLRRGKLIKKPCVWCGDPNVEMHHPNYDEPLKVVWLCRKCHVDHHGYGVRESG